MAGALDRYSGKMKGLRQRNGMRTMSDLAIILACLACYVVGGMSGMAIMLLLRQAKRADARENVANMRARRMLTPDLQAALRSWKSSTVR
jgi:hypothetical protein